MNRTILTALSLALIASATSHAEVLSSSFHRLGGVVHAASSVAPIDFDGDGDTDLLVTSDFSPSQGFESWVLFENLAPAGSGSAGPFRDFRSKSGSSGGRLQAAVGDIDGDSAPDFVIARSKTGPGSTIEFYRNPDGLGSFGPLNILGSEHVTAMRLADLDGDTDLDLVAISGQSNKLFWYENRDGAGDFGSVQVISTSFNGAADLDAGDLDGDGDIDLLTASRTDDTVAWFANDGSGGFGAPQVLSSLVDGASSVSIADIDGDSDLDIAAAARFGNQVVAFTNAGGGLFGSPTVIDASVVSPVAVELGDIGGASSELPDLIVISAADNSLRFRPNTGGSFGASQMIADTEGEPVFVTAIDFGGTKLSPMWVAAETGTIGIVESGAAFAAPGLLTHRAWTPSLPTTGDFDGDGRLDLIVPDGGVNEQSVSLYLGESTGGKLSFSPRQKICSGRSFGSVALALIDGDDEPDLLVGSTAGGIVEWYPVVGGTIGSAQNITVGGSRHSAVAADLDGDLDNDLVTTSNSGKPRWRENDGAGNFTLRAELDGLNGATNGLPAVGHIDSNAALDVVVVGSGGVVWLESNGGVGAGLDWTPHTVSTLIFDAVDLADIDGDTDLDIVVSGRTIDTVAWFENADGEGGFGPVRILNDPIAPDIDGPRDIEAADYDGDGDIDVVVADFATSRVVWFENTNGAGNFAPFQTIGARSMFPTSVLLADLDLDGDRDVVFTSTSSRQVGWSENRPLPDISTTPGAEPATSATVRIVLTEPAINAINESYVPASVSASAGVDFSAVGGTVTIPVGQRVATFTVPVFDDALREGSESLRIDFPASGSLFESITGVVIADNDPLFCAVPAPIVALAPSAVPSGYPTPTSLAVSEDFNLFFAGSEDDSGKGSVGIHKIGNGSEDSRLVGLGIIAGEAFGSSVSVFGDLLIVGARLKNSGLGGVHVFDMADSLSESIVAAPSPVAGEQFGTVVASSDKYLAVSAPGDLTAAGIGGRVVFYGDDSTTVIKTPTEGTGYFGVSLLFGPDWLAVGHLNDSLQGRIYFFDTSENNPEFSHFAEAPTPAGGDRFGAALALSPSGVGVWVGAPGQSGSVHLVDPVTGAVTLSFGAPDPLPDSGFGTSLAVAGNEVFVGRPGSVSEPGSVYGFHHSGGSSQPEFRFKRGAETVTNGDRFGSTLAASSGQNRLIARADSAPSSGSIHLLDLDTRVGTGFQAWIADNTLATDNPSAPAATEGNTLLQAYATGIDPVGGVTAAQEAEGLSEIGRDSSGTEFAFLIADHAGCDLQYIVEISADLITWSPLAKKTGLAPWTGDGSVTIDSLVLDGNPQLKVRVIDPSVPASRRAFGRLTVELLEP